MQKRFMAYSLKLLNDIEFVRPRSCWDFEDLPVARPGSCETDDFNSIAIHQKLLEFAGGKLDSLPFEHIERLAEYCQSVKI